MENELEEIIERYEMLESNNCDGVADSCGDGSCFLTVSSDYDSSAQEAVRKIAEDGNAPVLVSLFLGTQDGGGRPTEYDGFCVDYPYVIAGIEVESLLQKIQNSVESRDEWPTNEVFDVLLINLDTGSMEGRRYCSPLEPYEGLQKLNEKGLYGWSGTGTYDFFI